MKNTFCIVASLLFVWLTACQSQPPFASAQAVTENPLININAASLEVTYLANEGFMVAGGGHKVLLDALFGKGLRHYAAVSPAQRELLEQARAPYADVDAVFATHFHDDHFNAESVLSHLTHNPQAFFFSTNQAADKLRATGKFEPVKSRVMAALPKEGERLRHRHRGIDVQLLNIHHGRTRPTENLGFILELGGKRILHIGDSEAEPSVFQKYEVAKERIDVAFLPFWYFLNDESKRAVREHMQPRNIVVMHLEQDFLPGRTGHDNWQKRWAQIKAEFPNASYFTQELEKKQFD